MTDISGERARLLAEAIQKYGFRLPTMADTVEPGITAYLTALIEHVEQRDFSAAHEIVVGRQQADWTEADIKLFRERGEQRSGPRRAFVDDERELRALHLLDGGEHPVTFDAFHDCVEEILRAMMADIVDAERTDEDALVPVTAGVLLDTGQLLIATLDRSKRVAAVKALARTYPVFGFFVAYDGFIHSIETPQGGRHKAWRQDALLCRLGTRERDLIKRRPYHRAANGRAVFDAQMPDIEMRTETGRFSDPYSEIFVSVPTPERAQ